MAHPRALGTHCLARTSPLLPRPRHPGGPLRVGPLTIPSPLGECYGRSDLCLGPGRRRFDNPSTPQIPGRFDLLCPWFHWPFIQRISAPWAQAAILADCVRHGGKATRVQPVDIIRVPADSGSPEVPVVLTICAHGAGHLRPLVREARLASPGECRRAFADHIAKILASCAACRYSSLRPSRSIAALGTRHLAGPCRPVVQLNHGGAGPAAVLTFLARTMQENAVLDGRRRHDERRAK
jgi:hypothetical protein